MKLYAAALTQLLASLKSSKVSAILLYGPDKGLINHCHKTIASELKIETRSVPYKDAESMGFDILLNNASLFGGKELIIITEAPSSINADIKALILSKTHHIPVFIADELTTTSLIRKLFEADESLASVACYPDDENSVRKLISICISKEDKSIEPEAMRYLSYHLTGDRHLIMSELEKLMLYTHDKKTIDLEDVRACVSLGITSSPDILCTSFATSKPRVYFAESAKLLAENVSLVWMLRALTRYYINLYIVSNLMESGSSIEEAMRSLKPPIFFKYVDDFKTAIAKNDRAKIIKVLDLLCKAEINSKSHGASDQGICEKLFFDVWA